MANTFVVLSAGYTLKNRNGTWRIGNSSDKSGESLDMGQAEAGILMDLFRGMSLEKAAIFHGRSVDELRAFAEALSVEEVLSRAPVSASSLHRCFPDPHPLDSVCLLITNRCNLRCQHCYMSSGDGFSRELTGEQWVDVLEQARVLGAVGVNISGGEPLLHPDFGSIAEYLAHSQYHANLNTNGLLLGDYDMALLKASFDSIQVSLDDVDAEGHDSFRGRKGAYHKTIRAIRRLVETGIETRVAFVVTPTNIARLMDMVRLCVQLGVSTLNIGMPVSLGRAKTFTFLPLVGENGFMLELHKESKKLAEGDWGIELLLPFRVDGSSCGVDVETRLICGGENRQVLYVHADGEAVPCDKLPVEVFGAGNVRQESLHEIWHSKKMKSFKHMSPLDLPKCKECDMLESCGGACVARAYCESGTLTAADTASCFMARQCQLDTLNNER
ncbi:MAG: radical SAM protein [Planctomycetota bacterium]|nr:radical SAM protein [Planctomycetota bacterium]